MTAPRLAFCAADTDAAQAALDRLAERYAQVPIESADVIVALGGDGFLLQTLHRVIERGVPVFGMNRGSVGFLLNDWAEDGLPARIERATRVVLHPLRMDARTRDGQRTAAVAINEVSLFRQQRQTAKIRIAVDGVVRIEELSCDGVMVATPAGSTAYNLSAQGPILPINAPLLALTPISPFRPRRWRGALLPNTAYVVIEVLEGDKRPVAAVADHDEARDVRRVEVLSDKTISMRMLFDPGHSLEERILSEQFNY